MNRLAEIRTSWAAINAVGLADDAKDDRYSPVKEAGSDIDFLLNIIKRQELEIKRLKGK